MKTPDKRSINIPQNILYFKNIPKKYSVTIFEIFYLLDSKNYRFDTNITITNKRA